MKENWERTSLENLFAFVIGGDWGKDLNEIDPDFIEAYCIRGSEIKDWNKNKGKTASLRKIARTSVEKRKLEYGDILLEISGGGPDQPVGRTVFIDNDVFLFEPHTPKVCTNFLRLIRLIETVDKKFVNYYLTFFYKSGEVVNYQGGSNNLRNLKFAEYSKIKVPLPPLPEQKRIVAKLDTLFAHLDQLKARLQNIPILLKQFRQAVLTQAVTGKLTEEWRELNTVEPAVVALEAAKKEKRRLTSLGKLRKQKDLGVNVDDENFFDIPKSWVWCRWDDILAHDNHAMKRGPFGSALRKDFFVSNGVRVFEQYNPINDDPHWVRYYVTNEKFEELKDFTAKAGDLLISCSGVTLGRITELPHDVELGIINQALLKLELNKGIILNSYFIKLFRSQFIQDRILDQAQGTAIPNMVGVLELRKMPLPLPSLEEQNEILRSVESLFAVADRIEASYKTLQEKIDHLPQAILSKAFRGELVAAEETVAKYSEELEQLNMAAEP